MSALIPLVGLGLAYLSLKEQVKRNGNGNANMNMAEVRAVALPEVQPIPTVNIDGAAPVEADLSFTEYMNVFNRDPSIVSVLTPEGQPRSLPTPGANGADDIGCLLLGG